MRVPMNRAGKSARCPGCKMVVVVPFPPKEHQSGELLQAPFASSSFAEASSPNSESNPKSEGIAGSKKVPEQVGSEAESPPTEKRKPEAKRQPAPAPTKQGKRKTKRESPISITDSRSDGPSQLASSSIQIDTGIESRSETAIPDLNFGAEQKDFDFQASDRIMADEVLLESGPTESSGLSAIEKRAKRAMEDRITLTRFFAAFLVVVGLINFGPAIWCWYAWSQQDVDFVVPRWIYLQIFVAILHLVYAILLVQVPDWSTLRSIAVVMLVFAFVFGLFSMGLLTSGGGGVLAQYLQVPHSFAQQACIWCVAMLCLATLASYLAGRESNAWQRTEKLLGEVSKESA